MSADSGRERSAKPGEQHVAGGVTEAVVVGLEAVEVEHHERERAFGTDVGEDVCQVAFELATVAQAGQWIGARLNTALAQQRAVLRRAQAPS